MPLPLKKFEGVGEYDKALKEGLYVIFMKIFLKKEKLIATSELN